MKTQLIDDRDMSFFIGGSRDGKSFRTQRDKDYVFVAVPSFKPRLWNEGEKEISWSERYSRKMMSDNSRKFKMSIFVLDGISLETATARVRELLGSLSVATMRDLIQIP